MSISIIVAVSENDVIGKDNKLIWRLQNDLKRFKELTTGGVVIMGRNTYESIGKPLPNRRNIVLTRRADYQADGCTVVHDKMDALKEAAGFEEIFIIGGGEIYKEFWNDAERLYLTRVHITTGGDTFFPSISSERWKEEWKEEHQADAKNDHPFSFINYKRI